MNSVKKELKIDESSQFKEYKKSLTFGPQGKAIHITSPIKGKINHIIFSTDQLGELSVEVTPLNSPNFFILRTNKMKGFSVYSPRILATSNKTGEEIESPPVWSDIYVNDNLSITISNGKENNNIDISVIHG